MSEPTIVFVFEQAHWEMNITPLTKIDLIDIVPKIGSQFGYDFQAQAFLLVISRTKWLELDGDLKKKFMMISRRVKEEVNGPMTFMQREEYEKTDFFTAT